MKLIKAGSAIALAGYILSGPVGFLCIKLFSPQPEWVSAKVFANNYSIIQDLPFLLGFLLIGGMLILAIGHYLEADSENKTTCFTALVVTTIFASLISFNYICQTTFVRNLAIHYKPEFDMAITSFSMANPLSLAWSVEMWGYAFLGIATWLWAGYYRQSKTITLLLAANGIVSVLTAVVSLVNLEWIMSPAGLAGYMLWNVLMIIIMILIYRRAN